MNRTAKRFGNAAGAVVSAKTGRDSSHGKAMVTPAPARTLRREMPSADFFVRMGILFRPSLVHELRAGNDCLYQRSEAITIGREHASHPLHGGLVGQHQRPAKAVGQQLPAE